MKKRGISPLLAIIFVVAFVMILAVLVIIWTNNLFIISLLSEECKIEAENQCSKMDDLIFLNAVRYIDNKLEVNAFYIGEFDEPTITLSFYDGGRPISAVGEVIGPGTLNEWHDRSATYLWEDDEKVPLVDFVFATITPTLKTDPECESFVCSYRVSEDISDVQEEYGGGEPDDGDCPFTCSGIWGDLNRNGLIDFEDGAMSLDYQFAGGRLDEPECADYDRSCEITISDAIAVLADAVCLDGTEQFQCSEVNQFYYCDPSECGGDFHDCDPLVLKCEECTNGACSDDCLCDGGETCIDGVCVVGFI